MATVRGSCQLLLTKLLLSLAIFGCNSQMNGQKVQQYDRTLNFNSFLYRMVLDWPGVRRGTERVQVKGQGQKELKLWPWSGFSLSTQSSGQNECYDGH